jgi:hypothetical protein
MERSSPSSRPMKVSWPLALNNGYRPKYQEIAVRNRATSFFQDVDCMAPVGPRGLSDSTILLSARDFGGREPYALVNQCHHSQIDVCYDVRRLTNSRVPRETQLRLLKPHTKGIAATACNSPISITVPRAVNTRGAAPGAPWGGRPVYSSAFAGES